MGKTLTSSSLTVRLLINNQNLDSSGHVDNMMKTVLKLDPVFLNRSRPKTRATEKNQFRTRLVSLNSGPIRVPSCKDSDTPRSNESESRCDVKCVKKPEHKESEGSTKESQNKNVIKEVTVVRWIDYCHKYGVAYQLSNGSIGILYNDETKIIYNPFFDKMHYFNGLDMLITSHESFSTKQIDEYGNEMRKKVKILSYLKKMLKTGDAYISLTNKRESANDDIVVYLKKWSKVDDKLVFKLNSKLMQIVNTNNNEILLKYDIGQIELFVSETETKTATLSPASKKFIFNNSKTLSEKLQMIEDLVNGKENNHIDCTPVKANHNECSVLTSKFNTTIGDKSIYGFTPNSKADFSSSIRKKRYCIRNPTVDNHQSISYTPFKDLSTKTGSH
jgi:hypothetical protein